VDAIGLDISKSFPIAQGFVAPITFERTSPVDQVYRIYAARRAPGLDILVLVGFPMDEVLAPWRQLVRQRIFLALLSTSILLLVVFKGKARLARLRELNQNLESRLEGRTRELVEAHQELRAVSYTVFNELHEQSNQARTHLQLGLNGVEGELPSSARESFERAHHSLTAIGSIIEGLKSSPPPEIRKVSADDLPRPAVNKAARTPLKLI
jgi:hypothetical protein